MTALSGVGLLDVRVQLPYSPPSAAECYRFLLNIRSVYAGESDKPLTR